MIGNWRTALVVLGAALGGAVGLAVPAVAADVTVSPGSAARGGAAELTFQVPEERPGAYTTKVELQAPEATPIAEIYPLSVDDWAPMSTMRDLPQPIEAIHGTTTTQVVASITWIRVSGADSTPVKPAVLTVALGPMPQADRVVFTLVQTYSDGTVVRWGDLPGADGTRPPHPAPIVNLAGQAPAAAGDHGHGAGPGDAVAAPAVRRTAATNDGSYGILGAGLLVGLAAGIGVGGRLVLRGRRTAATAARASAAASRARPSDRTSDRQLTSSTASD